MIVITSDVRHINDKKVIRPKCCRQMKHMPVYCLIGILKQMASSSQSETLAKIKWKSGFDEPRRHLLSH